MTTAPTSQTILFMMISFPLLDQLFRKSGETDQLDDCKNDNHGADEPNDAVHDELSFLIVVKRTVEWGKRFRFWHRPEPLFCGYPPRLKIRRRGLPFHHHGAAGGSG